MPPTATDESTKAPERTEALAKIDTTGIGFFSGESFDLMQRVAKLLAASTLVPKDYQGNLPNCVIALNMAHRIGADPLMVMQNLYVVQGRPGWSSQFLIATFNQNGRFTALRYEFTGEAGSDKRGCRAWAIEKATGEKLVGSLVDLELAKKEGWFGRSGSKWQTMSEQMLMYRSAAWFIRAYAPEIAMGLHTADELQDSPIDLLPDGRGGYAAREIIQPDTLGAVVNGAEVSSQDNAPAGSNAPTREEAQQRQASAPPATPPASAQPNLGNF